MKQLRRSICILAVAFLLVSGAAVFGQPNTNFGGWPTQLQSRNIPAGTVQDPGSHLTYIVDTGINARQLLTKANGLPDVNLETATDRPIVDLAAFIDQNGDNQLDDRAIFQNFVAITNTHPTQAVTIHFRYYNDNCDDVLDFLVVLTCNDTLIFDPFNFVIPGTGGENTRDRIFGPARAGFVLEPIPTSLYGSGRFVITAAASGTSTDADDDAEIRFPRELLSLADATDCDNLVEGFFGTTSGLTAGNLHVFNASQVVYNYLIGHQTVAVPTGLISDPGAANDLAYGFPAWIRPAVDLTADSEDVSLLRGEPDGDGPPLTGINDFRIVTGSEAVFQANQVGTVTVNLLYLRNEVHGGDVMSIPVEGGDSHYGALGTTSIHVTSPENTVFQFLSVTDDYNGSNNLGVGAFQDTAANISPAVTTYVLQIYDNDENLLTFVVAPPLNVSPPRPGAEVNLKMVCICLRTFLTTTISPGTSVDDLTIQDMADIFGDEVLNGLGDFAGLLQATASDASGGWIRFVRDNTAGASISGADQAATGLTLTAGTATSHGTGTSTFQISDLADSLVQPSFLTFGQHITKFQGFGAAWHLHAAASDTLVSELGTEDPN